MHCITTAKTPLTQLGVDLKLPISLQSMFVCYMSLSLETHTSSFLILVIDCKSAWMAFQIVVQNPEWKLKSNFVYRSLQKMEWKLLIGRTSEFLIQCLQDLNWEKVSNKSCLMVVPLLWYLTNLKSLTWKLVLSAKATKTKGSKCAKAASAERYKHE